ncbi:hypothetical protein IG631_22015 [Alternaria alternata]|nr:hypothetical protein IG631_22015 [Alternaria alternata]
MPLIRAIDAPRRGRVEGHDSREGKPAFAAAVRYTWQLSCTHPCACVFVPIAMSRFSVSHLEPPLTPRLLFRTAPRPSPSCQRCMQGSPIGNDGFVSRRNRASRSLSDANDVVGVREKVSRLQANKAGRSLGRILIVARRQNGVSLSLARRRLALR